jgi:hypothetical protein
MNPGTPDLILTADLPCAATCSARTVELADASNHAGFAPSGTPPAAVAAAEGDTATSVAAPSSTARPAGHAASKTCRCCCPHAPAYRVGVGAHRPLAARLVVASAVAGTRGAPRAAATGGAGAPAAPARAARRPSRGAAAGPSDGTGHPSSTTETTSGTACLASTGSTPRSSTAGLPSTDRTSASAGPAACGTAGRRAPNPSNIAASTASRRTHAGVGRLLRFRTPAARTDDRQGQRKGVVREPAHAPK